MKPFLGIDLTEDKKNEKINGAKFLVAEPSSDKIRSFEDFSEDADKTIVKSKLPLPLRIIQGICGFIGLIIAASVFKALLETPVKQMYTNAPELFWLAGGCILVWGVLKFFSVKKEKSVFGAEEATDVITGLADVSGEIYSEMSVPSDAIEVDLLLFFYKVKNGEIKVCEKTMQLAQYFNPVFKVFADSENLYLANLEGKYAIPLSSLVSIRTVKKHIRLIGWNKDEDFNRGNYKEYKLTVDNLGCIHCRGYHILEFNHEGEAWGIYFPSYELPSFELLARLRAE